MEKGVRGREGEHGEGGGGDGGWGEGEGEGEGARRRWMWMWDGSDVWERRGEGVVGPITVISKNDVL